GGVDDLLVADAAVEGGAAVAEDLAVDLGAELLRAKEDNVQVSPTGGDIDEGVAQAALPASRSVLVQLVDEDDELVDAHLTLLCKLPDRVDRRGDDELLDVGVAAADIDDTELLVRERIVDLWRGAVMDRAVSEQAAELVAETLEPVLGLANGGLVVTVPGVLALAHRGRGVEVRLDLGEEGVEGIHRVDAAFAELVDEAEELVVEIVEVEYLVRVEQGTFERPEDREDAVRFAGRVSLRVQLLGVRAATEVDAHIR